jgi:general secretion pathway protein J
MTHARLHTGNAGFTLLEVIVVLVITSLISVVLIQGLGIVLGTRTRVAANILDLDRVVLHRNLVLEPLRGTVPDYTNHPFIFSGNGQRIRALTVRALEERMGTPTGYTMTLDYNSDRGETIVKYEEDGHEPIELMSWKGNSGTFSYRDRAGDWSDRWPTDKPASQTPWVIRLEPGDKETPTMVASIAGTHKRQLRMMDGPVDDSSMQ